MSETGLIHCVETCCKSIYDKKYLGAIERKIEEEHNIPISDIHDLITNKRNVNSYTKFELYCFLEACFSLDKAKDNIKLKESAMRLSNYFTDNEIKNYENKKIKTNTITVPFIINEVIQIADDQYITKMDVSKLMELKTCGLINYNENTQRTLRHIINGKEEQFQYSLNKTTVKKIRDSIDAGSFIPNTITLNMPTDDTDFEYKDNSLLIKEINHFDLIDGYHRYVAFSQKHILDSNWKFTVEVRIVNFTESRAQHFIYQEQQTTKMKKIDAEAFNKDSPGNICVQRLNNDSNFVLFGKLKPTNTNIIHPTYIANIINWVYEFDSKKVDRIKINKAKEDIINGFNEITSIDEANTIMSNCSSFFAYIYCYHNGCSDKYNEVYDEIKDIPMRQFKNKSIPNLIRKVVEVYGKRNI